MNKVLQVLHQWIVKQGKNSANDQRNLNKLETESISRFSKSMGMLLHFPLLLFSNELINVHHLQF